MRRVVVLGATGLLGHRVIESLQQRFDVVGTTQRTQILESRFPQRVATGLQCGIRAQQFSAVQRLIRDVQPVAVVNCIGIVKSQTVSVSPEELRTVNSEFPWRLAELCHGTHSRLIQVSTDCVFSGERGNYSELDIPDPVDAYGVSKLAGEPNLPGCLVLRTSFVGREYFSTRGLVEWLCSQRNNTVPGFRQAKFSGVTTAVLARLIGMLIDRHGDLTGTWHVAGEPVDKYTLLTQLSNALDLHVDVIPDDSLVCDRTLNGNAFAEVTGFLAPSWSEMVTELANDSRNYE